MPLEHEQREQHARLAGGQPLVEAHPVVLDGQPAQQPHAWAGRTPAHGVRDDGLVEALELHGPHRVELRRQAAAAEQTHDVGDEHLSARGGVAKPPRHDDRSAVEVPSVVDRLAGVDADTQLETVDMRRHGLLHGRSTRDGLACARERGHQSVAEALDLSPAVRVDRVAQGREVRAAQLVGGVVSERGDQVRRADEIGEQDGQGLRSAHSARS